MHLLPQALTRSVLATSTGPGCLPLPQPPRSAASAKPTPHPAQPAGDTPAPGREPEGPKPFTGDGAQYTQPSASSFSLCQQLCPLRPLDHRLKPCSSRCPSQQSQIAYILSESMYLFWDLDTESLQASATNQLASLLITSASSFLGQACSNFVRGRQRAGEPGNHSAWRCPWGTETGLLGPKTPNSFQMPMSWRQVRHPPAWTTDYCTPTPSSAHHSAHNHLWLMLLQRPQKYLPKERG